MAVTGGMSFDLNLSAALEEAKKLDKHFDSMLEKSQAISKNMRTALSAGGKDDLKQYVDGLKDLRELVGQIGSGKLAIDVDDKNVERLRTALGEIAKWTTHLADQGIEIFDTKGIYASNEGLLQAEKNLAKVSGEIQRIREEWTKIDSWNVDELAAAAKIANPRLTDRQAKKSVEDTQKKQKEALEKELAAEIESQEIAKNNLKFAKMTQDQKAEYIKKKIKEILDAEKAYANSVRREYAQLYRDLKSQQASIGAIDAQLAKGKVLSPEMEKQYNDLVDLEKETKAQMEKIEQDHLDYVSDLRVRYATRDAKEIAKILKTEVVDPQTALQKAADARTGLEMEAAKDAVQGALMTVDKDDLTTIAALNKAYIDLRASIEKLTKAQKNEQTLQPTLRNEYARILAEMDKIEQAKERLAATGAYQQAIIDGDSDAQEVKDYEALVKRFKDLEDRKAEIRNGNEALLTEIETKHEAERAQKRTEALERREKQEAEFAKKYGEISSVDAEQVVAQSQDASNVRQAEKAIQDLKDARDKLDKEDANYEETLEKLNDEIKKHEEYIESVTDAEKYREKQARQQRETYQGALDYSKQAKSLNDMKEAMRSLEVARNKEEVGTKKYMELDRELSRITKRYNELTKEVKSAHRGMWNIGEQIGRKIALWFSVSQVQGYIHKLMEVRGEFELQQRSLRAILQDKEAADEVWQKTIDLAVKSPFRIKDLVKYTKQLAAYRIESDKLYETNKMLADVSAGLGVDMDRLILAYGQVRSAEYLRGTELRQFTEAGIPMLEELSKLMSEMEDRSISTAEVFEMISKRMIGFAEVEEVFRRMTSAGGTFYQMQEKQADTLKGQMSNLKDSIDLMLNDIGVSMEGVLKSSVETVRRFVENWKDLADVLNTFPVKAILAIFAQTKLASSGLGKYFYNIAGKIPLVSDGLLGLEISVESLTKKSKLLGKAWGGLLKILGGTATAGITIGLIWLVKKITEAYLRTTELTRATQRLNKEWGRIFSEDIGDLNKSLNGYKDLVTRLEEANVGSEERARIISRLNNEYGEYLDFVVDEATSVEQLANSYDLVVKRMKEKASLNTYEKGVQAIEDEYTTALKYAKEEFYDLFEGMSIRKKDSSFGGIIPTTEDIDNIYALVQQKIQELGSDQMNTLAEQQKIIQEIVSGYYGEEFYLSRDYANAIDLMNVLAKKKEKEEELQKEIDARYKETLKSREANLAYQKLENKYKEDQRKINEKERGIDDEALRAFEVNKELEALRQQFEINKIQLQFDFGSISEQEMNEQKDKIVNWATDTTRSINEQIKSNLGDSFSELDLSRVLITRDKQEKGIAEYVKNITDGWEQQNKTIAEQISLKSQGISIDEKILEKALRMEELYRKVANLIGVELDYTVRLSEESRNAINALLPEDYQISLEQAYSGIDAILANLKTKETEHLNVIEQLNEQKKNGLPIDEEALRMAEESYWWTKKTQDLLDPKAKTAISQERVDEINAKLEEKYQIDSIDRTKDEVTLLSEANSEKQKAIAYEAQLIAMKAQGLNVSQEELDLAKKDVEQYTLLWKLLGGTEEEKKGRGPRDESLMEERVRVVKDMADAYRDLNQNLSKAESLEGAFSKYKDAYQRAFANTSLLPKNFSKLTAQEFLKTFDYTTEEGIIGFFDKVIPLAKKTSEKVSAELAKGDYIMETRLEIQKGEDQKLYDEIQEMFDQYDLSIELKNLGIPSKLGENLFGVKSSTLKELRESVIDAFMGVEFYNERIKDAGKLMEDTFNGNVDLLNRKLIPAQQLAAKGWQDVGDGLATVFSSSYSITDASGKNVDILVTPILPDGTVMSEKELENYIAKKIEGAEDVLKADDKGIIIHAGVDTKEGLGEYLHSLQEVFYASDMLSEDQKAKYKEFLEKIDDMENKASIERMKTYSKYLIEGMNERVKLKIEELRKLREIEENDDFTNAQKARIKDNVSKEARVEQQKQDWKDFQGSEMYTMMFEDIEYLGTTALNTLKEKLEELKGSLKDLPASEVKEIVGQISKIEDITIQRNPFESLRDAMKEVRELEAKGRTEEALQEEFARAEVQRMAYQEELDAINLILSAKGDKNLLAQQSEEWQEKYTMYLGMQTDELEDQRLAYSALVTGQGLVASNAATDLDAYADARKAIEAVVKQWEMFKQLADSAWGSAKQIMESLGVESDSLAMTIGDTAMSMVDLVFQAIMFDAQLKIMTFQAQLLGVAMNTALGPIGWIVLALQAVATLLTAIFSAKDKALQKQVEDNLAKVETLQKTYDKLEESIDDAWNTASIEQYNRELKATTQSMINAQKAAIAAQSKRKGANKEGSDAYNELQDMKEELNELEKQLEESLANSFSKVTDGILDGVHDAAREFTDAWYEAYAEAGDGLKGLEENFNEMFLNLAKNQAAMQITGRFADQWKKDLEKYINDEDTELTKDEAREWAEKVRATFPELSAALEGYLGAFKDMVAETEGAGLSALQKGIQGVTEQTAQVIEALLNSMRFTQMDSNNELKNQTKVLNNIYSLLNSMTTSQTSLSGRAFKTTMG